MLTVVDPGPATTVQDLGRSGHAHLGVSASGAADRRALMLANRLVGNESGAPALECTFGGLAVRLDVTRVVAVTGAPVPVRVDGRAVPDSTRFLVVAGQVIKLGRPTAGLRTYLAVSGGLRVDTVLGGAGYDALAGHGHPPLRAGDRIPFGPKRKPPELPVELAVSAVPAGSVTVEFRWGPRHELFDAASRNHFTATRWRVSTDADRVGVRLDGDPLQGADIHLPSEGMVRGAIQIPPSGLPIIFLADHPVTGGYPVLGVVTDRALGLIAQAAPGTGLHFRPRQAN